ncbi:MAG: hypothetical protein J0H17_02215 [Rhizobiales bacterium]|nr:hypothetical protein [Hyphomicrobiales bacterium]
MTAVFAETGPFMLRALDAVRGRWLPLWIYLLSYTATTALGGLYFMTSPGKADLLALLGEPVRKVEWVIASPTYLAVLLLPFFVVPVAAVFGAWVTRNVIPRRQLSDVPASFFVIGLLAVVAIAYCVFRLRREGSLLPDLTVDFRANILERVRLFDALGPIFYIMLYGILPMTAVMFLARLLRWHKIVDLVGFLVTFAAVYFFIFDTLAKSHLLVFSLMLIAVVLLSRVSIWLVPVLLVVSGLAFTLTDYALTGRAVAKLQGIAITESPKQPVPELKKEIEAAPQKTPEASPSTILRGPPVNPAVNPIKNIIFRMSTPLPFYVSIFEDPAERCGIEAHSVRRVLGLGPSACTLPIKVFAAMWPDIHWTTGFAPAAAHISAFGEAGLAWSVIVLIIAGFCLGAIGELATLGKGVIFVAIGAAGCTFAYYLTQLPLIAAFTYGHGLAFLLLPVIVTGAVGLGMKYARAG